MSFGPPRSNMKERDRIYLGHMLDIAREAVGRAAKLGRTGFDNDFDLRLALAHRVQTIGEAARRVSEKTQARHPEIPWRQIIGMRHKIVHDYLGVDYDIVWQVISADLPQLIPQLDLLVPSDDSDD